MPMQIGRRLHVTIPEAMRLARVDGWRVARWLADGRVQWNFTADGIVVIQVASLEEVLLPSESLIRSRLLLET